MCEKTARTGGSKERMRCGRSNGRLTAHPVEQFALTSQMPIVWRLQAPLAFAIDEFEPLSQPRIVGQVILSERDGGNPEHAVCIAHELIVVQALLCRWPCAVAVLDGHAVFGPIEIGFESTRAKDARSGIGRLDFLAEQRGLTPHSSLESRKMREHADLRFPGRTRSLQDLSGRPASSLGSREVVGICGESEKIVRCADGIVGEKPARSIGGERVVPAELKAKGDQIEPCKRARHLQKAEFGTAECDMQFRAVGKGRFVNQDKCPGRQGGLHAMESCPFGGAPFVSIGGEQLERLGHTREYT